MFTANRNRMGAAFTALLVTVAWATPGLAEVTANPATVTFTSPTQSHIIQLNANGAPISGRSVKSWKLLADDSDYKHMLKLEKVDGGIKLTPSDTVEVGSYQLRIQTSAGPVTVNVFTPLSEMPDAIDKVIAETGLPEAEAKKKLGLSRQFGRETLTLNLSPTYTVGQTLEIPITLAAGRVCTWSINGEIVAQGADQGTLNHTFTKPGDYVVEYIESTIRDGKPVVMARTTATTRVVAAN